jgi:hypothetical protein
MRGKYYFRVSGHLDRCPGFIASASLENPTMSRCPDVHGVHAKNITSKNFL